MVMPRFLGSYARQSVEASHYRAHILANVATNILNGVGRGECERFELVKFFASSASRAVRIAS